MKFGIIGAGQIGTTLARKFRALGHEVKIANSRGPQSLSAIAAELDVRAVEVSDAVRDVDAVVVAIPTKGVASLPQNLFDGVPTDVVVIDTGNYYPNLRDEPIEAIEQGMAESAWFAQKIRRPVVKVFNNIMAVSLAAEPRRDPKIALPISGDDIQAKALVIRLVQDLGYDAVDAGKLADSWRQQPGTPAYCTDLDATGLREALTKADRARAPELRDQAAIEYARLQRADSQLSKAPRSVGG